MDNNIGKKFGKWTVLSFSYKDNYNHFFYKCKCECGFVKDVDIYRMKYGHSLCCSRCSYDSKIVPSYIKKLRRIFNNFKQRCYNPKSPRYKNYGARGIIVCDEWKNNCDLFIEWALNNGYKDGLSIDRIDNDGIYSPQNCRWVDNVVQANNKSTNHIIFYKGEKYTISTFCKKFNLNVYKIRERINRYGFTEPELLLKESLLGYRKKKIFATINGVEKPVIDWCIELNLNYRTIYNRIHRYGFTPEKALLIPIKK